MWAGQKVRGSPRRAGVPRKHAWQARWLLFGTIFAILTGLLDEEQKLRSSWQDRAIAVAFHVVRRFSVVTATRLARTDRSPKIDNDETSRALTRR